MKGYKTSTDYKKLKELLDEDRFQECSHGIHESLEQSIDADKMIGLDEAAKKFCDKRAKSFYGYSEFTFQECCNAFKAGVKWRDAQIPKLPDNLQGLDEAAAAYDESESWRWEAPSYPRREAFKEGAKWVARHRLSCMIRSSIPEIVNEAIRERAYTDDPVKYVQFNETVYNVACEAVKIALSELP